MEALLTVFFFILIIGTLVFVHEFGHFAAAKISGVKVHQFAIGFGPVLFEKKFKETKYQIRIFPLGGFVELEGEQETKSPDGFRNKPLHIRVFILSAGVIMNMLVAIFFLTINLFIQDFRLTLAHLTNYNFINTETQVEAFPVTVGQVSEGGVSDGVLERLEIIIGINGEYFDNQEDFASKLRENREEQVTLNLIEFDTFEEYTKEITLAEGDEEGNNIIQFIPLFEFPSPGIGDDERTYFIKYEENIITPFSHTFDITAYQILSLGSIISDTAETGDFDDLSNSVGGPVALGDSVNRVVENEIYEAFFFLAGLLSISLAIMNILPLPALDGGQIVVAVFESIRRKKISDKTLSIINTAGFLFLILLSILITIKDVRQFIF